MALFVCKKGEIKMIYKITAKSEIAEIADKLPQRVK